MKKGPRRFLRARIVYQKSKWRPETPVVSILILDRYLMMEWSIPQNIKKRPKMLDIEIELPRRFEIGPVPDAVKKKMLEVWKR